MLERAFSKRRGVICHKLALSAKEAENSVDDHASDNSMESSDNDNSDGENIASVFDIWSFINNILDDENVSVSVRTKRGVELILFYIRNADAWCHDSI